MPAHDPEQITRLVAELEACADPGLRKTAADLVAALMDLHAGALARILELVGDNAARTPLVDDPQVRAVLLLHELHPADTRTRVLQALEQVRPSLQAHKGDVALLELGENTVRLELLGTCNGCPSSTSTFRNLIETAINELAPEIEKIELEGARRA